MNTLENYIFPTQEKLFSMLKQKYAKQAVVCDSNYILVKGSLPVMLLAHLDTVHAKPVQQICTSQNGDILMSPQGIGGDDRCGVYAICSTYAQAVIKPWLLFTCDEEVGGLGAQQFCADYRAKRLPKELDDLKCLIELDRKGKNDAVYYDCANQAFEEYITSKGFHTEWGSFSDISYIAPELGIAAVNLSSGYYNAHMLHEYINRSDLESTIRKVESILVDAAKKAFPKYEYIGIETMWESNISRYINGGKEKLWLQRHFLDPDDDIRYDRLLDFYTASELNMFIEQNGEQVIRRIYESEIGNEEELYSPCFRSYNYGSF